ncbi:MAG: TonB-dependent receptor [Rikenellaceae bacterium]
MKKTIISILFFISIASFLNAQTINGVVKVQRANGEVEPLAYASIYWLEGKVSFVSNDDGHFSFNSNKSENISLIAAYIGYTKDTIILENGQNNVEFILKESNNLNEVKVIGRQQGNYLSKVTPVKTEVISAAGLCKMACCNLAESFENSASVTVGYADAITGARQIRLLGLSGQYTQMLDENRPVMRGIASPFGLSYIPGQWLESIQIAKGPSSVVNGLEAITGQINLEHRKPTTEQPLFVNLFLSNSLRSEANIASSLQLGPRLSTVIFGHFSTDPMGHDGNHDGFKDEPVSMQFNLANRWLYVAGNGTQIRFGFKALSDDRLAGQNDFKKNSPRDLTIWGSRIKNKGVNGFLKVGVPLNKENSKNIATVIDYTFHKLDSYFGMKDYNAEQNSAFMNLMFMNNINENHKYIIGLSGQYDNFDELVKNPMGNIVDPSREERSLGGYGEYTYTNGTKFTLVAGLRLDNNNLHGWLFAPRMNLKYAFVEKLVLRASGGRGFRSSNVIADNLGMLSTGREIRIDDNLNIEDAWTYGANLTGYFPLGFGKDASLSFDYFRTDFNKQIIVDQERDLSYIWLYNLSGRSFTNTYQMDFTVEPIERFTVLATFRYTDAKVTLNGQGLVEKPLTSKYKGVLNLQYATRMNMWTFDITAQLNGPSRLYYFADMDKSPVYAMLYAQVTKKFKDLDVYIGGENLTNYRQHNPIIDAQNPYSPNFNSTVIWGPLMGVKIYAGLRFTIWK